MLRTRENVGGEASLPGGVDPAIPTFPTVADGALGVHFVARALESHRRRAWVDAAYTPPT
jgi:hypothetical protein